MAKNYRIMRYRQKDWAIMDCDEKGRPITMTPVKTHRTYAGIMGLYDELTKSEETVSEGDKKSKRK
jgi:hypothetical protein